MPAFAHVRARQTADHADIAFIARVHAVDDTNSAFHWSAREVATVEEDAE
ncbi:hypothetical protein [Aquisalimonas asiatica]|uniref:Uncharacterized protein n=1 Tax=Aquisalimonas asiatica TaxID=406100 RepID=A0A1H8VPS9_9GAMM|nr:hypothetical protein [Aquisalimonas asiatica]SEP17406.1 hypothetical protein SAMN04488052_11432 [Aquisalimonas asiatica]